MTEEQRGEKRPRIEAGSGAEAMPEFSKRTKERLEAMKGLTDYTLRSRDGAEFKLHRAVLMQQSTMLRYMIQDVEASNKVTLEADAAMVMLLVDAMYNTHLPVTDANVSELLEIGRKYRIDDQLDNCKAYLNAVPLTLESLPRVLKLAAEYSFGPAVERFEAYVAQDDNFEALTKLHGEMWWSELPSAQIGNILWNHIRWMDPYVKACNVYMRTFSEARRYIAEGDRAWYKGRGERWPTRMNEIDKPSREYGPDRLEPRTIDQLAIRAYLLNKAEVGPEAVSPLLPVLPVVDDSSYGYISD